MPRDGAAAAAANRRSVKRWRGRQQLRAERLGEPRDFGWTIKWALVDWPFFNTYVREFFSNDPRLLARRLDVGEWQAVAILRHGLDADAWDWHRYVAARLMGAMGVSPSKFYQGTDLARCRFGSGGSIRRV